MSEKISNLNEREESLREAADRIKNNCSNLKDLIIAIGEFIHDHANSVLERRQPKSIIESRFTPAEEAYKSGMTSCGAMANISTDMLRHLGYQVKLIHGECEKSVDHAWISVLDPEDNVWKEYDLTRADVSIPETHIKKQEVSSWDDIKDQIFIDHDTLSERQRERGIK